MSYRFTETEKWKDPWFRKLSPNAKCLWEYMRDNCDCAGILEWDAEDAMFRTGLKQKDLEAACEGLARGYIAACGHIMLRTFLKHQKNVPLNENNNAHRGIMRRLQEASEIFPNALKELNDRGVLNIQEGASKGLLSPSYRGLGNGKGNGKGIGTGKKGGCKGGGFKSWSKEDLRSDCLKVNDGLLTETEVSEFVDYWTEQSDTGRYRFAMEKTWDTRRRMQTALRVVYQNQRVDSKPRDWRGDMSTVPKLGGDK